MQRVCILHGSGHQKEQIPIRVSAFFARWRFEESNATIRWTVARWVGPQRHLYFPSRENANESPAGHHYHPIQTFISALEALQ